MKLNKLTFSEVAQVFTITAIVAAGFYGIYLAGKSIVILPAHEFDQATGNYPSLEAAADEHALKAPVLE